MMTIQSADVIRETIKPISKIMPLKVKLILHKNILNITQRTGLFPRKIKLYNNIKIFTVHAATIFINLIDMYVKQEYFAHRDFIPRSGWTVVDVGAYIGLYTIFASYSVGAKGQVISFEPNPLAYYWLKQNIELNRLRNVEVYPVALGSNCGHTTLNIALDENMESSSIISSHVEGTIIKEVKVPILTFDKFVKLRGINKVDLMKIDVEGYELEVLKGCEKVLSNSIIKRLVIEVHRDVIPLQFIISFLKSYRYKIVKIYNVTGNKSIVYAKVQEAI